MGWIGSGALGGYKASGTNNYPSSSGTAIDNNNGINIDASRSSSVYQNNAPVQQAALCMQVIIKY